MSNARAMLSRCALTLLLAMGIAVGMVSSASAHDVLISSDPKDGATVTTAPSTISFTFDQPVQNFDPVVSLVGPDNKQYATGTPSINGNVVTGSVTLGPPGSYTAAYRIVSADGHPVTGEIHFTLTGGGSTTASSGSGPPAPVVTASQGGLSSTGSPAALPPTSTSSTSTPAPSSGGLSGWLWIGLIIAAAVIAAAAVILLRRPKQRPSPGPAGPGDR